MAWLLAAMLAAWPHPPEELALIHLWASVQVLYLEKIRVFQAGAARIVQHGIIQEDLAPVVGVWR